MILKLPKLPLVRFHRGIPLIPGMLWLNIFKWGVSLSIGSQGFRLTFGKAKVRATVGLTGTGLFLTKNVQYSELPPFIRMPSDNEDRRSSLTTKTPKKTHGK